MLILIINCSLLILLTMNDLWETNKQKNKKKNLFVIYALFSVSLYLSSISIGVISYRISSSGFSYATLSYPDMKQTRTEQDRKKWEKIYLSCSSFFFFYIYPESFIHNLFFLAPSLSLSRSFSLWLLSIKYYPEATRTRKDSPSHRLFWLEYKG
jgi:hypothetical protein